MEKKDDTQKENPVPPPKPPRLGKRPTPIETGAISSEDSQRSTQPPRRNEPTASTGCPATPSKLIKLQNLRLFSEDAESTSSCDSAISNVEVVPPAQPTSTHGRLVSEGGDVEVRQRSNVPERSQSFPQRDEEQLEGPRPFARLKHRNDSPTSTEDQEMQESAGSVIDEDITPASSISISSVGAVVGSTLSIPSSTDGQSLESLSEQTDSNGLGTVQPTREPSVALPRLASEGGNVEQQQISSEPERPQSLPQQDQEKL